MKTERGLERLVFFSDAVVAVAITLLVLPLVDIWPESAPAGASLGAALGEHAGRFLAFGISFAVIARFWLIHHRIFERVLAASPAIVALNFAWLLTVVVLPVWTAVITAYNPSALTVGLYSGTVALSSLLLTALSEVLRRHPQQSEPGHAQTAAGVVRGAVPTVLAVLGGLLGVLSPDRINYLGLLLLLLAWPVTVLVQRLTGTRDPTRRAPVASQPDRAQDLG